MTLVSFNPSTFVEGGLIDDVDVEFKEVQWCAYDYQGSVAQPVLALGIKMSTPDPDKPGAMKEFDQYYSAGDLEKFQPTQDGFGLEAVGDKAALNNNTNVAKFFASLLTASNNELGPVLDSGSLQGLVGLKCHVARVAQPKRSGIVRTGKNADREASILLVNRIIAYPGQAGQLGGAATKPAAKVGMAKPAAAAPAKIGGAKPTAAAPAATTAVQGAAGSNGSADLDSLALEVLMELLATAGGSMAKKDLPAAAFKSEALKANPTMKTKVVPRIIAEDFLASAAASGIAYDGATVTLG